MVGVKKRDQLKWFIVILSWALKELESCASNKEQHKGHVDGTQCQPPVVRSVKPLPSTSTKEQQDTAIYKTLLKNGKQMPIRSRLKIIPRILFLVKDVMVSDKAGAQKTAIADSIEEMLKWIMEGCKMWQDLGAYQVLAVVLSSYAEQQPELEKIKRIADQFSKTIDKIRLESTGKPECCQAKDIAPTTTATREALGEKKGNEAKLNENGKQREFGKLSSPKLELTRGNCLEKLRMMTQSSVGARSKHLPDVLAKLTDIVLASAKQEQLSVLKYVLLWAKLSAGNGDDLAVFDQFCKGMTAIINKSPESGRRAGLERLNNSLLALLKEHET